MVKINSVMGLLLLCASLVAAKEVKVRTAWTRTFPNTSLGILSDNIGHVAALGSDTNGSFVFLLDDKGRTVARSPVSIPGVASAVADKNGRIFVTGNVYGTVTIQCVAFAPLLSTVLWNHSNHLGFYYSPPGYQATLGPTAPDELGGAFVMAGWRYGQVMSHFSAEGSELRGIFDGQNVPYRIPVSVVRASNSDVFFVGNVQGWRERWITVVKWNPSSPTNEIYGRSRPGINGYGRAVAAACDSQGNLVIVGEHTVEYSYQNPYAIGYCSTLKLDPHGIVLWHLRYGGFGSGANAVAVDKSDNIIMSGSAGAVKYSPTGQILWETPEFNGALHVDRFDNILFSRRATGIDGFSESEIIQLSSDGRLRWKIRFNDGTSSDCWPAGLMTDDEGNIYAAVASESGSSIAKFVEHGQDKQ